MEKFCVSDEYGQRSSERRFMEASVFCLGLLNVFLMAGLIGLYVYYHGAVNELDAELSTVKANLTQCLQNEEKDQLNAKLSEMAKELNRLQSLSKQRCPIGWTMFSHSCYVLSTESGSWEKGREDCRARGADLVVIDSREEQTFLSEFNRDYTWIGLTDTETEATWKWIDGTPVTLTYWASNQPDNGSGGLWKSEEDCAHIRSNAVWNDLSCTAALKWICEKTA